MKSDTPTVLFVCIHNAGRSQMAETLFNAYAKGKARAASAGVEPVQALNPVAIAAMKEAGFDMSTQRPKLMTNELVESSDRVITMGCIDDEACPAIHADEDWGLDDPAGAPLPKVREIRDEIARRVRKLLSELGIDPV
ncbi:MAG: arsenate reductase ArsC [Actinomycetota bacterium]